MKCLCCNKTIENPTEYEISWQWHAKCVKNFFGVDNIPSLELNESRLLEIATQETKLGHAVAGVQKKLSLHLSKEKPARLTLVGYPFGFILKPQTNDYPSLPENEYAAMLMAKEIGLDVVPFALIKVSGNELAYITKRIDRNGNKKCAMEDFCQLDGRLTEDKYKGSYERCAKIVKTYSHLGLFDCAELFYRLAFCYLIGNSDMHLKNFSLIAKEDGHYRIAPAYDLLSVKLAMDDEEDMALSLNGKKRNLHRGDFLKYGVEIGMAKNACSKILDRLLENVPTLIGIVEDSRLSDELKKKWKAIISKNAARLSTLE